MTTRTTTRAPQINEAAIEAEVLRHLTKVLPGAVHKAVHSFLAAPVTVAEPKQADERQTRNGVRHPKPDGRCHSVWKRMDKMRAAGMQPTLLEVFAVAEAEGWNKNNARIEFYNWRRFHGYSTAKPKQVAEHRKAERRVKAGKAPRRMKDRRAVVSRRAVA